jgi:uncharacterized protein YacL
MAEGFAGDGGDYRRRCGEYPEVDAKLKLAPPVEVRVSSPTTSTSTASDLQGVKVLNINELAHAVKPILIPGEDEVKTTQDGKDSAGVGYLDDGTIVVENGKTHMGDTIDVTVTRSRPSLGG